MLSATTEWYRGAVGYGDYSSLTGVWALFLRECFSGRRDVYSMVSVALGTSLPRHSIDV